MDLAGLSICNNRGIKMKIADLNTLNVFDSISDKHGNVWCINEININPLFVQYTLALGNVIKTIELSELLRDYNKVE